MELLGLSQVRPWGLATWAFKLFTPKGALAELGPCADGGSGKGAPPVKGGESKYHFRALLADTS